MRLRRDWPNGKPDFSGVWESRVPPSGRPGAALPSIGDAPPVATFFNIAANIKEGLPFSRGRANCVIRAWPLT